jgi:hypothetical protein
MGLQMLNISSLEYELYTLASIWITCSVSIWITCCQYQYESHAVSINMNHMLSVNLHLAEKFLLKNHL